MQEEDNQVRSYMQKACHRVVSRQNGGPVSVLREFCPLQVTTVNSVAAVSTSPATVLQILAQQQSLNTKSKFEHIFI